MFLAFGASSGIQSWVFSNIREKRYSPVPVERRVLTLCSWLGGGEPIKVGWAEMFYTDTNQREYKAIISLGLPPLQPDMLAALAVTYLYLRKEAKLLSFLIWLGGETQRDVSHQVESQYLRQVWRPCTGKDLHAVCCKTFHVS